MGIQQLDMFASFQPEPAIPEKQEETEVRPGVVPEESPEPVIAEELKEVATAEMEPLELIAPAMPEQIPADIHVKKDVVFADDKISIRIKPKTVVQTPVASKEVVSFVRPKSKRGRKSYKEIDAEVDLIEIPEEEVLNQKLYYSITEVAKWFRVNASLLRYWENEFDILKPRKNRKGDRLFRPEDIKNLQVIYYLLRNRKFSLEGAKKYLRNNRQQADVNVQLTQSLTKFRSFLLELKANLGA